MICVGTGAESATSHLSSFLLASFSQRPLEEEEEEEEEGWRQRQEKRLLDFTPFL
jgi:hypothetical protein